MPLECISKPLQRELADSIIRLAHPDDLRILLACGAKVNDAVTQGLRPIHYAVWQRYPEAVQLLLARGCNVNSTDDCGYSPLHLAAEHGYLEMVQLLLDNGAKTDYREYVDPEILFPRTTISDEPLRLAIKNDHMDCARLLLEHGADPNARYFFGAEINLIPPVDVEYLELLLNFGAFPDSRDRQGLTPLHRACRIPQAFKSVVCLVLHGADVNIMADERHEYRTALHYAVISGSLRTVSYLLERGSKINFYKVYQQPSPLDLAILRGHVEMVELLLSAGANVNASSPQVGAPLHVVVSSGVENRIPILKLLLEKGADPNYTCVSEDNMPLKSPLGEYLSANEKLDITCVRLLLKYGAKVIFKSQFRHPLGILNCLTNVTKPEYAQIFDELLEAAEDFDPPIIKRCLALSETQKHQLLSLSRNPASLKNQCRSYLSQLLGTEKLIQIVDQLSLPTILQRYLLFHA